MTELGRPVSNAELFELVKRRGVDTNINHVGTTLRRGVRAGRFERLANGLWVKRGTNIPTPLEEVDARINTVENQNEKDLDA